jgi:hypothetical protein
MYIDLVQSILRGCWCSPVRQLVGSAGAGDCVYTMWRQYSVTYTYRITIGSETKLYISVSQAIVDAMTLTQGRSRSRSTEVGSVGPQPAFGSTRISRTSCNTDRECSIICETLRGACRCIIR